MKRNKNVWRTFQIKHGMLLPWDNAKGLRFSLKWRMIHMLLICWALPVVLLVLISGAYLRQSIIDQSMERLQLSVDSALQLATMRMEAAVDASREISYIGAVRTAWDQYAQDDDVVTLYDTTRSALEQEYQTDEKFVSVILLFSAFADDPIYVVNNTVGTSERRVRDDAEEILTQAQVLSETIDTSIAFFSIGSRVFMVRNLVNSSYEPIAVLMMELNTELLFTEFSKISNIELSAVMIDDITISLVAENPPEANLAPRDISELPIDTQGEDGLFIEYRDNAMYTQVRVRANDYDFAYYAISYPSILHEQWNMTIVVLVFIFLLMLPMGALILSFFMRHINKPVRALITSADEIRMKKYGVQVPEYALESLEIGALGDNFNRMSLTLQEQFDHIYKEEILLRDAKIMALQSQINPHFLNNTLEIINWEARMQGDLKVCNMLESLSTMLNAAMDRKNRPIVHLSEELMYVEAYLYIIRQRLGKRLSFQKDIPDDLLDCAVPRLILQPILENAVNHGITPVQQGLITLRAERKGDWLILSVENDGQLSENDHQRILTVLRDDYMPDTLSSGSLGLRNVHQRLRILYGEESGILVDVNKKDVTAFQLKVKLD